jgi:primase-polymerase (primpol)-like protein
MGSYSEVSPSGTGVKVFLRGKLPAGGNRRGNVEMYDRGRYFAVTGRRLDSSPATVNDRGQELAELHRRVFPIRPAATPRPPRNGYDSPIFFKARAADGPPTHDDAELLRRASEAANGDKFRRLWADDTAGYQSPSEADLALCRLLAFWTGPDPDRIDRLFRQSGLMRPKWDERRGGRTYGQVTVGKALEGATFSGGGTMDEQDNGAGGDGDPARNGVVRNSRRGKAQRRPGPCRMFRNGR